MLLVFADSRESPALSNFEERVEAASLRVTKELVLCHPETTRIPARTRAVNEPSRVAQCPEKAPTRAFSLLKVYTSTFRIENILKTLC